jgi:CheY-like chemotaxis protein
MKPNGKQPEDPGSETVLVIEDDRALRRGLAMNFELRGFRVLTAADGDEGIKLAFDSAPDLIVLDIMLPGFSGLEILSELREKGRDVPILILSAQGSTDHKIEGLGLGADDYLAKPFALSELFARVEAQLRRRRAEKKKNPQLVFGDLTIDRPARRVTLSGKGVEPARPARLFAGTISLTGSGDSDSKAQPGRLIILSSAFVRRSRPIPPDRPSSRPSVKSGTSSTARAPRPESKTLQLPQGQIVFGRFPVSVVPDPLEVELRAGTIAGQRLHLPDVRVSFRQSALIAGLGQKLLGAHLTGKKPHDLRRPGLGVDVRQPAFQE